MRRDDGENFRRWKRDVQKEADAVANAQLPTGLGEGDQMVVVDPDDVVGLEQRLQLFGKHRIDPAIAVIFLAVVARQVDAVMEDRPQRGIGKAPVVLIVIALGQAQGHIGDIADSFTLHAGRCAHVTIPAEPDPAGLAQRIVDPDRQSAGRYLAGADRRDAVGHHN